MQLNRQRAPTTSLEAVLLELGLKAKKGTKSSDYAGHQVAPRYCVLLERGIIFRWRPPSKDRLNRPLNYLEWPAISLQPLDERTDSDSDDFLVAVLCRCREFAQQARNGAARDPKVVVAIKLRDDRTIDLLSKVHADCFAKLTQGGAALEDCRLESFLARTVPLHSPVGRPAAGSSPVPR